MDKAELKQLAAQKGPAMFESIAKCFLSLGYQVESNSSNLAKVNHGSGSRIIFSLRSRTGGDIVFTEDDANRIAAELKVKIAATLEGLYVRGVLLNNHMGIKVNSIFYVAVQF
jgi:hypothetical protein